MCKTFAVFLAILLAACGYKGPLEMPAGSAPEPVLGYPKTTQPNPAVNTVPDVSTDKKALFQ